jgi:hypothetical protein
MDEPKTYAVLTRMAGSPRQRINIPKTQEFSRQDVVNALQSAFEMIGGVQRLALWGHANPDKFYAIYSRLLPSTTVNIGNANKVEILHAIAKTVLDEHPEDPDDAAGQE